MALGPRQASQWYFFLFLLVYTYLQYLNGIVGEKVRKGGIEKGGEKEREKRFSFDTQCHDFLLPPDAVNAADDQIVLSIPQISVVYPQSAPNII